MRLRAPLHLSPLLVALLLAFAWAAVAQTEVRPAAEPGGTIPPIIYKPGERPPDAQYLKLTLPGTGFGVDERGLVDPGGASHLNIPLGYTLASGQFVGSLWALDTGDEWSGLGSATLGLSSPERGISLTFSGADRGGSDAFSGHVQAQIWPETRHIPAVSAGVFDAFDHYERSYYVAATKRLSKVHPKRVTFGATSPSWPAGPSTPTVEDPRTWGTLAFLAKGAEPSEDGAAPDRIEVPFSEYPAILDGMIGREWEDAALVRLALPNSEFLIVGLKRDAVALYCVLAIPSTRGIPDGSRAEICFETPRTGADSLGETHRRFALVWNARKEAARQLFGGLKRGQWTEWDCAPPAEGKPRSYEGAVSNAGDGAWRFPVFEFSVPLAQLGPDADAAPLGFCALVNLPGTQAPGVLQSGPEYRVQWPFGRGSYQQNASEQVFARRPDLWGQVLFEDRRVRGERLHAVATDTPPTEDGVLAEGEWATADSVERDVAPGVTQTVYLQRSRDFLHLASAWEVSAGEWQDQVVDIMLDPLGDQGIWPRDDDRLLRVSLTKDGPALESLFWHPRRKRWVPADQLPPLPCGMQHAAVRPVPFEAQGAVHVGPDGTRSVVEARIPLAALGIDVDSAPERIVGLAVETRVTAIPANLISPGSLVEKDSGASTFVTAGWGSGAFDDSLFYGVSHPIGDYRGIAEYDGDAINVGLTGSLDRDKKLRFTLGWSEPDDVRGTPILGASWGTEF